MRELAHPLNQLEYMPLSPQQFEKEYERYRTQNNLLTTVKGISLGEKVSEALNGEDEQAFARKAGINPVVLRAIRFGFLPVARVSDEFLARIMEASSLDDLEPSFFVV